MSSEHEDVLSARPDGEHMRILLAPHGTRGDVQPIVALAVALRARGHIVSLTVPADFVSWVRGYGFATESDGIDVEALESVTSTKRCGNAFESDWTSARISGAK